MTVTLSRLRLMTRSAILSRADSHRGVPGRISAHNGKYGFSVFNERGRETLLKSDKICHLSEECER